MRDSDTATPADDDWCRTEALFNGEDDGAYQTGSSSSYSLRIHGRTSLVDPEAASAVSDPVSGFRIVEEREPKSRRKGDLKVLQGDRYVCLWTPCGSSRTFNRPAELQRHYTDKHVRPNVYRCTALVHTKPCSKEYYRLDKLRYHIRTEHPRETEFVCPIPPCNAGPYTFDLLCVHVPSHDPATVRIFLGPAESCYEAKNPPLVCPVKDCGTKVNYYGSRHHLLSHDTDTRASNQEAIRGAGYSELDGLKLCPICGDSIDIRYTGLGPVGNNWLDHMFQHEPEMLHKHRRDIFKIYPRFASSDPFRNNVFKDVLATVLAKK
ncbi:Zinc finger, C2H2-like [Lasallia pustulata]|nr:Zinc finger, C2H2-like [Lasallia pustulata]